MNIIPFLHQTTTSRRNQRTHIELNIIPFLHQTTTPSRLYLQGYRWISFRFYIKPQLWIGVFVEGGVEYHSVFTSNHNSARSSVPFSSLNIIPFLHQTTTRIMIERIKQVLNIIPFLHQTTTKGTKLNNALKLNIIPFLHQTTTRCPIQSLHRWLNIIPFLHQTTTQAYRRRSPPRLNIIPFLHQTTTGAALLWRDRGWISFRFYIKPQLFGEGVGLLERWISFRFYIKPQLHCWTIYEMLSWISFHFYIKPQPA